MNDKFREEAIRVFERTACKPIYEMVNGVNAVVDFVIEYYTTPRHETVEQWEERTGEKYPSDAPVWVKSPNFPLYLGEYEGMKIYPERCIVANHHGKPDLPLD